MADTDIKYLDTKDFEIKVNFIGFNLAKLARTRGFWLKASSSKKRKLWSSYTSGLHEVYDSESKDWMFEYCPLDILRMWITARYGIDFLINPEYNGELKKYSYTVVISEDQKILSNDYYDSYDSALEIAMECALETLPELIKVK